MSPSALQITASALFAVAIVHTFSTAWFERLARLRPRHAGVWRLLGEVEVVFGFWAFILVFAIFVLNGAQAAKDYVDTRNYTEPLFVFAIMVIAGTRAILQCVRGCVDLIARLIPIPPSTALLASTLTVVPLLGSFITEPAAMTIAAFMLRERIFPGASTRLKYMTFGVLLVNISIGGVLTPYAAPPVLMVAAKWGWDLPFMLTTFGWKAALAVIANACLLSWWFRHELRARRLDADQPLAPAVPAPLVIAHLMFLAGAVVFAHDIPLFMGLLLLMLGLEQAYPQHQDRLILREALLVALFLAGLVVLGGLQQWWLQPALSAMSNEEVFWGATALTAFADNAAITYLGSQVEGLSDPFKYALVAGAVTGGGLTLIANAPNPAGAAILSGEFEDGIRPWNLFLAALAPTLVAILAFRLL